MTVEAQRSQDELTSTVEHALRGAVSGDIRFDDYTRQLFSRDASMYSITPLGVVFPRDADDVVAAVTVANDHNVAVLPRGAGTSLAGQTVGSGLVLDFSRYMNNIIDINLDEQVAQVQPGVVQEQLNKAVAKHGLMFGPDTSTANRATIGGMIGNNSAGSGSVLYGMTIDHVIDLHVVLSDGSSAFFAPLDDAEVRRRAEQKTLEGVLYRQLPKLIADNRSAINDNYPDFWRRANGYRLDRLADSSPFDLAKFLVGAEGTLAVTTSATVNLVEKPKYTVIGVGHFVSTPHAIAATDDALACDPAAVELMDRTILDLSRQKIEYASLGSILEGDPDALLFVSFTGDDKDQLIDRLDRLVSLWKKHGHGYHTLRAITPQQQNSLMKVRKSSLGLLMAASVGSRRPLAFVEDTAVDPRYLAEYTTRFKSILDKYDMEAGFYGHCSVGCLHIRPFVDLSRPDEVNKMRRVAEEVKDLVGEYGGVNSSEHGDGLARSEFNKEIFGPQLYEAMRQVKRIFDPKNIMNPGKIVDAPAMTDNLRDVALPPAPHFDTRLSFEVIGGMRNAADRCMNIGLCRKQESGAMCPSYMATLNEEDSTRGRANALVKALSEPDPKAALGDERLHEILDLCLMCKACKSECPLSVDMATLKSETLSHYYDMHGVPLRSRIFGNIRLLNRLGSWAAPLSNIPGRIRWIRRVMRRFVGITDKRPLPHYQRMNTVRWYRKRKKTSTAVSQGNVILLADSFTTYTEPVIGQAAVRLLESAGWQVQLESGGCCGRSSLSKGLVDDAKDKAKNLVSRLAATDTAAPIVGCEPSCLLTLKDETHTLLPDDFRVSAVAGRVQQIEALLTQAIDDGYIVLNEQAWPANSRILFHGHCHQKAEVGTAATVGLLKRLPGVEVVELDAGCCGMAGSFGFEDEHYDVSMTVGKDRLFPAINAESSSTIIAATGVSCRQQIFHGTTRRAWHPLELVLAAVDEKA